MIESIEETRQLFEQIDAKLSKRATVYVIGGIALMFRKMKLATKDIDFVVPTKQDYVSILGALKSLGFRETALTKGIERLNISNTLEKGDARIDLFMETVCGKLSLSKEMRSRAEPLLKLNNLWVKLCSNEDLFVFKSITEREGDKSDCEELVKNGVNWNAILGEAMGQAKKGSQIWVTYINERLLELESKGFKIPIIKKIEKETEKYYLEMENNPKENKKRGK